MSLFQSQQKKEFTTYLNLGGGKQKPLELQEPYFLVNVDKLYFQHSDISSVECHHQNLKLLKDSMTQYINYDISSFMERYSEIFNVVTLYRVLEHIPRQDVLYFIYLISTIIKDDGVVDIIVPDYKILAKRILEEKPYDINFESEDIITSTELFNESQDPHCLITTLERVEKLFELEKRFKLLEYEENYLFDQRDIYLRMKFKRI